MAAQARGAVSGLLMGTVLVAPGAYTLSHPFQAVLTHSIDLQWLCCVCACH